jgi:hypothetical protein
MYLNWMIRNAAITLVEIIDHWYIYLLLRVFKEPYYFLQVPESC